MGSNNSGYYDLQAVLTHQGRSSSSGHYVGWVKRKEGNRSHFGTSRCRSDIGHQSYTKLIKHLQVPDTQFFFFFSCAIHFQTSGSSLTTIK